VLQVTVNGTTFTLGSSSQLTSDNSGHWTLATTAAIADGTYNVTVHTADAAGNAADFTATNALTIQTASYSPPTVNSLTTTNPTPTLTGTWDSSNATLLQVTISNAALSYSATYTLGSSPQLSTSGGNWTLNLAGTTPLAVGTYNVVVHTGNGIGQSADSATGLLTISPVSIGADLKVTGNQNLQISAADPSANHNFNVTFVSGGVQLTGLDGTTFNGAATLVVASVKSLSVQLGTGNDRVNITGTGGAVSLSLGGGQNDVTFQNFNGGNVKLSSSGALSTHALNTTLSSLMVTGGSSADLFQASHLRVTGETQLALGGGANSVEIDDSHFKGFRLQSTGTGAIIRIEAGTADGIGTQFDGNVNLQLGGGAQLYFSQNSDSDPTTFKGNLNINAGSPNAKWHRQNVTFAHKSTLNHVDIV
jgi:hypothetical protein